MPRQIAAWGARHNDVIAVRGLLADVIERRGRLVEASKHRRDNVDACVGDDGKPSASAPTHMARLARNLQRQGQVAEAAPWFLRSLELLPNGRRNDTAGKTLAASYGRALCDLDRRAEGEPLCVEFIAACAGIADADLQPPVREELGLSLLELGRHADAEPHLRAAVDASLANVAANVGPLVELAALHGACLAQTRDTATAATRLDKVLATARTACGDDADVVHKLAAVRAEFGAEAGRPGR